MKHESNNRKQSFTKHWSTTNLNVEEMVQNALNYAKVAVKQAGLLTGSSIGHNLPLKPMTKSHTPRPKMKANIEESPTHIRIKLPFPVGLHPRQYRFFVSSQGLTWTGIQQQQPQSVPFPALVDKRTARAIFKNHTLHVHIQKLQKKDTPHEIYVRYLD